MTTTYHASHLGNQIRQQALLAARLDLTAAATGAHRSKGLEGSLRWLIDSSLALDQDQRVSLESFIRDLAAASGISAGLDLAFVVFGEQIRQHNDAIKTKIQQVRNTSAARKVLSERITQLRQLQSRVKSMNNDDGDRPEAHRYSAGEIANESLSAAKINEGLVIKRYEIDPRTGAITSVDTGTRIGHHQDGKVSADMIAERIKELEVMAQELDSNREISLIELNSLISKKANLVELLSNVEKKKHESRRSVIGNLR